MAGLIRLLSPDTIDKISAGEVVEKPASVVKELTENAIDAGADKITVEIKEGGITFIRVTDNGCGIYREDIENAFVRHATSKITSLEDLDDIASLGFRGEALSSISAVSKVSLTTKRKDDLTGINVECNGGELGEIKEVGAPDGTTIIVKDLFYNTPARKKFLRTSMTEGSYISELMEHLAMSHPNVAISFIMNGKNKFFTSGNGDLSEIIYRIYGKETAKNLIPVDKETEGIHISGFLGKTILARSNRSYEIFFVNSRYVRSKIISQALEEGYAGFLMQHKYPFAVLHIDVDGTMIDVNVHPTKMEIRIMDPKPFASFLIETVKEAVGQSVLMPEYIAFEEEERKKDEEKRLVNTTYHAPEPFETRTAQPIETPQEVNAALQADIAPAAFKVIGNPEPKKTQSNIVKNVIKKEDPYVGKAVQMELFNEAMDLAEKPALYENEKPMDSFRIIGQVFATYWIVEYNEKIYFVDQHAAHEKVNYEKWMEKLRNKENPTQQLMPPIVVTLTKKEEITLAKYLDHFTFLGFEIEDSSGSEIAIRGIPLDLYGSDARELFLSVLDELTEFPLKGNPEIVNAKIASMSCKAAIKGNQTISLGEAKTLLRKLFSLQNPYHCPHGRPTMFSMSKYEMEKRFKRVI